MPTRESIEAALEFALAQEKYLKANGWIKTGEKVLVLDPEISVGGNGPTKLTVDTIPQWTDGPNGSSFTQRAAVNEQLSRDPRNSLVARRDLRNLRDKARAIQDDIRLVQRSCTHKDKDGNRTTNPTGGGFAQCWVCDAEID